MSKFGERIAILAEKLGKEHQAVAKDLGLTKSQLSHYTTGARNVPSELLQKIVDVYGINPKFLFKEGVPLYEEKVKKDSRNNYPYYPVKISAGLPLNVESIKQDDVEQISIPDSVMGKWAGNKDIFMLRVNGESMNNVIPHGSLIAVKSIELSSLKEGDIVVYSDGNDYSVKRFYRDDIRLIFRPDSKDPSFYDYITSIDNDNLVIHGKVVVYIVELD